MTGAAVRAFAASNVTCSGDACDGGAWALARGVSNRGSYWSMSPGHNCTNYVAWRLIGAGVEKPASHPGNASSWATRAARDGIRVDGTPAVGAVAQWDSLAGGYSSKGHVAYVERVNSDGTILVSEDYWRGGTQTGELTYRTIDAGSPSHYIHYVGEPTWLRSASLADGSWSSADTGLRVVPGAISAAGLGGAPEIYYSADGRLMQATRGPSGWSAVDSGIRSNATALSTVVMDGTRPYVMAIDDGALVMNVRVDVGWQRMPTEFAITGEIAAVNLSGLTPTVYLSQKGQLWRLWGDMDGWHSEATGAEVSGPIAAVVDAGGWPSVFSIQGGMLFRAWEDAGGWHTEPTGVTARGAIQAVQTATGPQIFLVHDGAVDRVQTDGYSWSKIRTGLQGGSSLAVADLGGAAPIIVQAG